MIKDILKTLILFDLQFKVNVYKYSLISECTYFQVTDYT